MINLTDIETYFKFISSNSPETVFTLTLMDLKSDKVLPGYGHWFLKLQEIVTEGVKTLENLNATLHCTLNETSVLGRKIKDIQSCRVLCVDLDKPTEREVLRAWVEEFKVQMVVKSSPEKYHLYWRIKPEIGLDMWTKFQLGLAWKFGGDRNLATLNKMIRTPGVTRVCKDGSEFLPEIIWKVDDNKEVLNFDTDTGQLDYDGVLRVFPGILEWIDLAKGEEKVHRREVKNAGELSVEGVKLAAKKDGRNTSLYNALKKHVYMNLEELSLEEVEELGKIYNEEFEEKLDESEVLKTAKSAWEKGLEAREKRKMQENEKLNALTPIRIEDLNAPPLASENGSYSPFSYDFSHTMLCDNRYTEQGLAGRVLQRFGGSLLRVGKQFYAFNHQQKIWKIQEDNNQPELIDFMHQCARDILHESEFNTVFCMTGDKQSAEKTRKAQEKFTSIRLYMQSAKLLKNLIQVNCGDLSIFDAQPHLFHCKNGVVDMLTGELRDATPKDYLLAQSSVVWNKEAKCEWWKKYLAEIFSCNESTPEMIEFMQQLFGYSISGSIHEQVVFVHFGSGCNGKSKVLRALHTIGSYYSTMLDPDDMVRSKTGFVKPAEKFGAKIEGKRVVIVDDIDVRTVWNESFVRSVTAPEIRARAEYEKSRVIANRSALHLGTNSMPAPEAENYGLLRRMCIIPYKKQYTQDAEMSRVIDSKIEEEREGILVWAVQGFQKWHQNKKLLKSREFEASVEEYRSEHFTIDRVMEALFAIPSKDGEGEWEWLTDLVEDVNKYLRDSGEAQSIDVKGLSQAFKRKQGFKCEKRWHSDKKNMFRAVFVKLLFERTRDLHSMGL